MASKEPVWCRGSPLQTRWVGGLPSVDAAVLKDGDEASGGFKLQGLVSAVISYLSEQGCKEPVRPRAVC